MVDDLAHRTLAALAGLSALLLCQAAPAAPPSRWVASWASAQQVPEPQNSLPADALDDATLRQLVRLSIGGRRLRVKLSNRHGTEPLRIDAVSVAPAADPASPRLAGPARIATFGGLRHVVVPAGADYVSDPVDLSAPALSTLAISLHLPKSPARQTGHPGSRATSYWLRGDHVAEADLPQASKVDHWYQLAGVEVEAPRGSAAVAALGDSITDGNGVLPNTNRRWTDYLAQRLQASPATRHIAVLNLGIGGNRLLLDGLGPNAAARFDRDVLAQPGVRWVILLEGVNDLGTLTRDAPVSPERHRALVEEMILAYRQMVGRARERGIKVIACTILPYGGSDYYHPGPENEADRQAVNRWIRTPGNVDAVIDLDALMRDPKAPNRLRRDLDKGDGLHPSDAGYRAMAEAVPLELFGGR
jgi:lysophospholipase L1-like esterase